MRDVIPESRAYVHRRCGEVTEVSGGSFRNLASPVPRINFTLCVDCDDFFPMAEFEWEDTAEGIEEYYARYRKRIPATVQFVGSRSFGSLLAVMGLLLGVATGIWCARTFGTSAGIVVGCFGTVAGARAGRRIWSIVGSRMLARALDVPDLRCLR